MQTVTEEFRPVTEQISGLGETYPHSIALSYGDQQLSYEELNRSAERFCRIFEAARCRVRRRGCHLHGAVGRLDRGGSGRVS
jgi:hypothetical protein